MKQTLITLSLILSSSAFAADSISYSVHLNGDRTPGKVDAILEFHMDGNRNVNFDYLLQAVKDVDMGNAISERLMREKAAPLKWLKSVMTLKPIQPAEANTGYTYQYKVDAFVDMMMMRKVTRKTSFIKCKDSLTGERGSRKWLFECVVVLKGPQAQDAPEFFSSYSQSMYSANQKPDNYCFENGSAIDCRVHVTAVLKRINVPTIAEVLFGTKDYSPGQAGHKFIENLLQGYFVLFELVKLPKPFENQVTNAVTQFKKSDHQRDFTDWTQTFPKADTELSAQSH